MIETFDQLKEWIIFDAKITTQMQMDCHVEFCANPTREIGFKFLALHGASEKVGWDAVFGIAPREE